MTKDGSDELGKTATAAEGSRTPAPPLSETLGRYRLEREIGSGGMGVVHVAFDPALERRIALKVLRATTSPDAAKRLLREARAMARLNHPNVVTVHEVDSVNGRDYIAMELVEGQTLAEWLKLEKRSATEVLDAFVQAGRGLAAAHAAGVVHRDFKPHNVLRTHDDGRIEVTDFGLAREAHIEAPSDPLAMTMPLPSDAATATSTPSALSGLTVSGAVLGTPAYMAPEQWSGGAITPATDQFAFCVALWEALTGERPYPGPTVEALREQVEEGPHALDASKVPRRLRSVLRRGLDPAAKRRWTSMDALLGQIDRAGRVPLIAIGAVGAALAIAGLVLFFALGGARDREPDAVVCPAPALDPNAVWTDAARMAIVANQQGPAADLIAEDVKRWRGVRQRACTADLAVRGARLACLDGVLATLDAAARGLEQLRDLPHVDIGDLLIDPAVCEGSRPPNLIAPTSQVREVLIARMREAADIEEASLPAMVALRDRVDSDPCASAYANALVMTAGQRDLEARKDAADRASQASDRCADDRVRADTAIDLAYNAMRGTLIGKEILEEIRRAELAIQAVPQPDMTAKLDLMRMTIAARGEAITESLERGHTAMAGFAARGRVEAQIAAGLATLGIRTTRGTAEDFAAVRPALVEWRQLAIDRLGPASEILRAVEVADADHAWSEGDVAGAHARLEALRRPQRIDTPIRVTGRVLDANGAPVAGAVVTVGTDLVGDSVGAALAFSGRGSMRTAITGPGGVFELAEAPSSGVIVAQLGDQRAPAKVIAPSVELRLAPTSRIAGTVALGGQPAQRFMVSVTPQDRPDDVAYTLIAPVRADGTFMFEGAPRGKLRITTAVGAMTGGAGAVKNIEVTGPTLTGVALDAIASQRTIHVLVRSTVDTPAANAQVIVVGGRITSGTARTFTDIAKKQAGQVANRFALPILGEAMPEQLRPAAKPGDLFATLEVSTGEHASACAVGLPADLADPKLQKTIDANLDKVELRCTPIPPDAKYVIVEVPPWPRFD